ANQEKPALAQVDQVGDEEKADNEEGGGNKKRRPVRNCGRQIFRRGYGYVSHEPLMLKKTPGPRQLTRRPEQFKWLVRVLLDRTGRIGSPFGHRAVIHGGVLVATNFVQGKPGNRSPVPGIAEDDIILVR